MKHYDSESTETEDSADSDCSEGAKKHTVKKKTASRKPRKRNRSTVDNKAAPKKQDVQKKKTATNKKAAATTKNKKSSKVKGDGNATEEYQDIFLVTEILNQREDPPDWTVGAFATMENPALRWATLVGQWQLEECPEPEVFEAMDLFDVADAILEWKREHDDSADSDWSGGEMGGKTPPKKAATKKKTATKNEKPGKA
jgi:hypothetical protein